MSLSWRARSLVQGRPWIAEDNVRPRGLMAEPNACYDLALYAHPSEEGQAVLVVKTVLQFVFLDWEDLDWSSYERKIGKGEVRFGDDSALNMAHRAARYAYRRPWSDARGNSTQEYRTWVASAEGEQAVRDQMHAWSSEDKNDYMRGWKRVLHQAWDLKHELRTDSRVAGFKRVVVVHDVQTTSSGTIFDHYELNAIHVGPSDSGDGPQSAVSREEGQAYVDNRDVQRRASIPQTGSAHEFGHMQGLGDEYGTRSGPPHWIDDVSSIMNNGMEIRPRHYTPLAEWVGRKSRERFEDYMSPAELDTVEYYVLGGGTRWTVANAGIYR